MQRELKIIDDITKHIANCRTINNNHYQDDDKDHDHDKRIFDQTLPTLVCGFHGNLLYRFFLSPFGPPDNLDLQLNKIISNFEGFANRVNVIFGGYSSAGINDRRLQSNRKAAHAIIFLRRHPWKLYR
jgi:hypothetical protein